MNPTIQSERPGPCAKQEPGQQSTEDWASVPSPSQKRKPVSIAEHHEFRIRLLIGNRKGGRR